MKTIALCCALLYCVASVAGEDVILRGIKPGTYTLEVASGGAVSITPARLVNVGGVPAPNPTPGPGPSTPFELEIKAQSAKVLANGGTKTTGAALSSVYSLVADSVAEGSVTPEMALKAIKAATDMVLANQADKEAWLPWRTAVGDALTKLQQDGSLATKEQYVSTLRQIAGGLKQATGFRQEPQALASQDPAGKGIVGGIDIGKIIELIKLIMELLKLFGG